MEHESLDEISQLTLAPNRYLPAGPNKYFN